MFSVKIFSIKILLRGRSENEERDSIADDQLVIKQNEKVAGEIRARAQRGWKMGAGTQWGSKVQSLGPPKSAKRPVNPETFQGRGQEHRAL